MKAMVQMLEGEGDKLTMPPNPFASTNPTRINVSMHIRHLNPELEVILELEKVYKVGVLDNHKSCNHVVIKD